MKYIFWAALLFWAVTGLNVQQSPVKLPWNPRAITVDAEDNLYIEMENMLMKLTPGGQSSFVSENIAKDFRGVVKPSAELMVSDSKGNIFLTRPYMESIWKLSMDGRFSVHAAGENYQNAWAEPAKTPVQLAEIEFMVNGKDDVIYFSSRYQHSSTSVFYRLYVNNEQELLRDRNGDTIRIRQVDGIGVDGRGYGGGWPLWQKAFCPVYVQGDISKAELVQAGSIVFNRKGELILADVRMNRIIKVANNRVRTVAGCSEIELCGVNIGGRSKEGYKDGKALAIDSKDNIYILDGGNDAIRKLSPDGLVSTVARRY